MIKVYIDTGTGWTDTYNDHFFLGSKTPVKITETEFNNLKANTNSVSLQVHNSFKSVLQLSDSDIPIQIRDDSTNLFTGYIRPKWTEGLKNNVNSNITISAVDENYNLAKEINTSLNMSGFKIYDPADQANSILHNVLSLTNISVIKADFSNILTVVPYLFISIDDDKKFTDFLNTLLYEYGYYYTIDGDGAFYIHEIVSTTLTATETITDGDFFSTAPANKSEDKYTSIKVKFKELKEESDIIVYSEAEGATDKLKCNFIIPANGEYPTDSDETDTYLDFAIDGKTLKYVLNPVLSKTSSHSLTQTTFENLYTKLKVCLSNGSSANTITKLDIKGTAVYEDEEYEYEKELNNKGLVSLLDYTCTHIQTTTDGQHLLDVLASYYKYSDYSYTLYSHNNYASGSIVQLSSVRMGVSTIGRIIKKETKLSKVQTVYTYTIEALSPYEVFTPDQTSSNRSSSAPSATVQALQETAENSVSYSEIVEGFENDYGTKIPEKLTEIAYSNSYRNNTIVWTAQSTLTNLKSYLIRVSEDETNWYDLCNDGTDWKGTGSYSTSDLPFVVHANIPNVNTSGVITGRQLYYQIAQITLLDTMSDWSDSFTLTTTPINYDDIGEGAVTADNLAQDSVGLQSLDTDSLYPDIKNNIETTGLSFEQNETPVTDDIRNFIDHDQLTMQKYDGANWQDIFNIDDTGSIETIGALSMQVDQAIESTFSALVNYIYPSMSGIDTWINGDKLDYPNYSIGLIADSQIVFGEADAQTINGAINTNTGEFKWFGSIIDGDDNQYLNDKQIYPIGFVYLQLMGESSPSDLGLPGTWSNVSSTHAGRFFRAEGGEAEEYGETQSSQNKYHNHTATASGGAHGHQIRYSISNYTSATAASWFRRSAYVLRGCNYGLGTVSTGWDSSMVNTDTGSHSHSITTDYNGDSTCTESRPDNETIRVWKRTA